MQQQQPGLQRAESLEEALIAQCAPVLAGLKTAGLFRYGCVGAENAWAQALRCAWLLKEKGLLLRVLKECPDGGLLVYVYRKSMLERDLMRPEACAILRAYGYAWPEDTGRALKTLTSRLAGKDGFPHEIGLFLGYPVEDVRGFILNRGHNYCLCGYWKVYENPEHAKKLFAHYGKCRRIYRTHYSRGSTLKKLAVSG